MSVKATERSMHVSLYMRGPLSRGCTTLGFCWHVLTGLRAPWSLLWGGEGRQKRLSGPTSELAPCSAVRIFHSVLVIPYWSSSTLVAGGGLLCTNRLRYYCVCSCSRSLFTCSEISVPSTQVGGRHWEPVSSQDPRSGAGPLCRCT